MSAWPDYEGKVINIEFRVSDDPKAAEWLSKKLDKIVDDSQFDVTYHGVEFVTGWGDLAEVRT